MHDRRPQGRSLDDHFDEVQRESLSVLTYCRRSGLRRQANHGRSAEDLVLVHELRVDLLAMARIPNLWNSPRLLDPGRVLRPGETLPVRDDS